MTPGPLPPTRRALLLAAGLVLAGCGGGSSAGPSPGGVAAAAPAARFDALEARLLDARRVAFDFHVTATGAAEIDVAGRLDLRRDGGVELEAVGAFAGQPVDLLIRTRDDDYIFGRAADPATAPAPDSLRQALLIGLTRMGILHNLARLTGNAAPDHAEGGVADWVRVGPFVAPGEPVPVDAARPAADGIPFAIEVAGQPAGSAVLELDSAGRPRLRRQAVRFPSGVMNVVERYSDVVLDPPPAP